MALDKVMMNRQAFESSHTSVRFYTWKPWSISLGKNQTLPPLPDHLASDLKNIHIVRRMTGGRAVLHGPELTYCITITKKSPFYDSSVTGSYRKISEALALGLQILGARVSLASGRNSGRRSSGPSFCYGAASFHEIISDNRKLIGSAQMRSGETVLQHGSIPLALPMAQLRALARWCAFPADEIESSAISLEQILGYRPEPENCARAIALGFMKYLNIDSNSANLFRPLPRTWIEMAQAQSDSYIITR
jgi:lipoate-protein ligase A